VALNAGVALVAVGWPLGVPQAVTAGMALFAAALLLTVGLTVAALRVPQPGNPRH
jgi:sulfite exporter TauE/SafE